MGVVSVRVRRDRGDEREEAWQVVEARDDQDVADLAEGLRKHYDLPSMQGSDALLYYLEHREGREGKRNVSIKPGETLAAAGVQSEHHLTLATEPNAGR
jgi:hypothetical protein